MNILIVCSGNAPHFNFEKHQAFIYDQLQALQQILPDAQFDTFFIRGKGVSGYLSSLKKLKHTLREKKYRCVHAHFCHSAMLANLQRSVPVVSTFHGSDINMSKNRMISAIVGLLSRKTIYVSQKLRENAIVTSKKKDYVIPCGVDFDRFKPMPKMAARQTMGLNSEKKIILFASSFDVPVKNAALAKNAIELLNNPDVILMELKGYTRDEVSLLLSAADVALMTSFSEGSPQFIKEAMACNCPIVTTDVGDVREVIGDTEGCYITGYDPEDVAEKIELALALNKRTNGREKIKHLDNQRIARKILDVYNTLES